MICRHEAVDGFSSVRGVAARLGRGFPTAVLAAASLLVTSGCATETKPPAAPPPPVFTGPRFLYGTVGSLASLRGYEPTLVSGYGLVVNLNKTGAADVPASLKKWLSNEMSKQGVSPDIMASQNIAVVAVYGLIPPGATKGTRFDVLVEALPQTQTTSLEGGNLWTCSLSIGGDNDPNAFLQPQARAHGSTYLNPFSVDTPAEKQVSLRRTGAVIAGGEAIRDQPLELILNQPSWERSRRIADRINERFGRSPIDRIDTAVAKTDQIISLNIPNRYADRPEALIKLIARLYISSGNVNYEPEVAQRLIDQLRTDPQAYADDVLSALIALGKTSLPTLRRFYNDPNRGVRVVVLEAGSTLADEAAIDPVIQLARGVDAEARRRAAVMLVRVPSSVRGSDTLEQLLSDSDKAVRLTAYHALSDSGSAIVQRVPIGTLDEFKFLLDLVPSDKPMIYVCQADVPRLVIFGPRTGFNFPVMARLWNNRLMLRAPAPNDEAEVFYQAPNQPDSIRQKITPEVADLAFYLGQRPSLDNNRPGLDLSYSQVVNAIYTLQQSGAIKADMELQVSPLADMVQQVNSSSPAMRPETNGPATQPATEGPRAQR